VFTIEAKRVLTPVTKLIVVQAPMVARKAKPGQFVILRCTESGERIPLTIADYDREKGTITLVYQEVGKTTRLLGRMGVGDAILDLVGPLGMPAELPREGRVLCVGGGVGVAPVYPKAKAMHELGVDVVSIIGARSADLLILEEEMRAVSSAVYVATDDGSRGHHGFVSDVIKQLLERGEKFDEIIAVGPILMMRACVEVTRPYAVKTWVSMNPIMVDGTGMCGACRLSVGGKTKFCCVDGPMFDGHAVDWAEAVRRSRIYLEEEKIAVDHMNCAEGGCRP